MEYLMIVLTFQFFFFTSFIISSIINGKKDINNEN